MNKTPFEEFSDSYKNLILTIAEKLRLDKLINWIENKINKFMNNK